MKLRFVLLAIVPISAALAQSAIVCQLAGAVTDANGAAIPGATITVANEATGLPRTVTANDAGFYVVTNLPPGSYTVTTECQGFKKSVRAGNNLVADGRLTVDFTLEAGEVSETVEVISQSGEAVNTTSGEVARVVDAQQVAR